jgi:hypothetical protein
MKRFIFLVPILLVLFALGSPVAASYTPPVTPEPTNPICNNHEPPQCMGIDISIQAEGPDSRTVVSGSVVPFQITVANTDNLDIDEIIVVVNQPTDDCDQTLNPIAAFASFSYTCTASNVTFGSTYVATVYATRAEAPFKGDYVTDSDPSTVEVEEAPGIDGRITGGGNVFLEDGSKVTRGLELHCDGRAPNNLEVNFHSTNDKFHLDNQADLLFAECQEWPLLLQDPPPGTPFDTFIGKGVGTYNNEPGAVACFVLVDDGEPGTTDMMAVQVFYPVADPTTITCQPINLGKAFDGTPQFPLLTSGAGEVRYVSGVLKNGNLQAHDDNQ